jgi:hypothetical protein
LKNPTDFISMVNKVLRVAQLGDRVALMLVLCMSFELVWFVDFWTIYIIVMPNNALVNFCK